MLQCENILSLPKDDTSEIITRVIPFSHSIQYKKNDMVVMGGEKARFIYYIQRGTLEVSHMIGDTRIVVTLIGSGELFGEIGFFDGKSRVRDIRATECSKVHSFDGHSMRRIQLEDPLLYSQFLDLIIRNICNKFRRILADREPLMAYAASLSTGRKNFDRPLSLPTHVLKTPEWRSINGIVHDLKSHFFKITYRLQENKDNEPDITRGLRNECHQLLDHFNDQLQDACQEFGGTDILGNAWGFIFKEIFPYFMRSRFAERAYFKPKGFAGDYVMMEMIYSNNPEGDGKLGVLVDEWCLNTTSAKAVRGRRELLKIRLQTMCDQRIGYGEPIRIMNLGCGSARELFDFLSCCEYSETIHATCVDADLKALEFIAHHVDRFPHKASIRLMHDNVIKWSLGRVSHEYGLHDIIYSAGLTDYLDRRLFLALLNTCYQHLKPGGKLVIGNFGKNNPHRAFMDHLLHWRLIHRNHKEMSELFSKSFFGTGIDIVSEAQGVNIFAVAQKK